MADNETRETWRRGPSLPMLLAGVLALLISVWALRGPDTWPAHHHVVHFGWIAIAFAIVVGISMVAGPSRHRRRRRHR
ncbi:hypothetical protein [Nocardia stercoris]|uniref:Uncharacterized protein n=1 Tax=Nocardia stercoris TaxID=2483361 RepID=A0A3M2L253_9NOCA|nr:hypothetical protein [Nocardia stercoris]RMI31799.1 hypothetical protein EBN03_16560 [Nocardia stercoris]